MAKIVVIDDSTLMRRYIRHHLEETGHAVEEWADLSAATGGGDPAQAP